MEVMKYSRIGWWVREEVSGRVVGGGRVER